MYHRQSRALARSSQPNQQQAGMAQSSVNLSYEQFVVVAEDQCKFSIPRGSGYNYHQYDDDYGENHGQPMPIPGFSVYFAGYEECTYTSANSVTLEFKGFARGRLSEVHLEVLLCDDKFKLLPGFPMRQLLTTDSSIWKYKLPTFYDSINMTIRVLKDRPFFPDFTSPKVLIGGQKSNGKLRVGDIVFHVNKELLSTFSPYFNALFNGNFNDAKQDEIQLQGETETRNPALFHDFLMTICLTNKNFQDALPNVKNVAGLLALATFYQIDLVRDKCERHLKFGHEMSAADRFALAKKHGLKDLMEQKTLEDCREITYASIDAEF